MSQENSSQTSIPPSSSQLSQGQQQSDNADGNQKKELSICEQLTRPAEEFVNDPNIEQAWLSTTIRHMETYYKLITSPLINSPADIRLTPNDDLIFNMFKESFPDLNVKCFTVDDIKGEKAKVSWRKFCEDLKDKVEDYNFATILRLNSRQGYSEENTVVVPRVQFLAIEITRNRLGFNDNLPPPSDD